MAPRKIRKAEANAPALPEWPITGPPRLTPDTRPPSKLRSRCPAVSTCTGGPHGLCRTSEFPVQAGSPRQRMQPCEVPAVGSFPAGGKPPAK